MNEWNNDDQSMNTGPGAPDPSAFEPVEVDERVTRGNRGILIAFLALLAVGAVVAFLWFRDYQEQQVWQKKLDTALEIKDDAAFKAAMRDILAQCDRTDILAQAALELGEIRDEQAVPLLIKALDKGGLVAEQAALALAKIATPEARQATEAIYKQLQQAVDLRKAKFAWALVVLGDDRGFAPLLEGIAKQIVDSRSIDGFDPNVLTKMATTDKLIELAKAKDDMLRMYAAMELGFRTDKDVVPALLELLNDSNEKVAKEAAISLGRTADDRAGQALIAKIQESPDLQDAILGSVAQSVGAPGLETIYKHTDDRALKYKIIGKLKALKDPRSADFLLTVLDEKFPGSDKEAVKQADEIRNQALWILEALGDKRIAEAMYEKTQWEPVSPEQIPDDAVRYRQNDMYRKIANGVVSWFGTVQPDGAADYLMKLYEQNAPYENTPECAKRVKVDIGPLMDAMGRTGDQRFCKIIEPFLTKDEGFYSQAASMALGRLQCKGTAAAFKKRMVMTAKERKEEAFATAIASRNWQMEGRLQERRNAIIASRYLGDPSLAETLISIALDPMDDPELRAEAANSLAYVADETAMDLILEKVRDESIDIVARASLLKGLWHNPTPKVVESLMQLMETSENPRIVHAAAIGVGEAGLAEYEERLNKLLDSSSEIQQRGAVIAILLGGNLKRLDKILEIMDDEEAKLVIRQWYEEHPLYITQKMFDSKRIYKRLAIAKELADRTARDQNILWPWKHLTDRLAKGWDTSPGGMTALQVRMELMRVAENDPEYRDLAIEILRGMGERGILLAIQGGDSEGAEAARKALASMNRSSS